jgi:carboxyl-terminal processing protease
MINKLAFYLLTLVLVLHIGFSQKTHETNVDTSSVEPLSEEEIQNLLDELDESFYILKDNYVDDINDLEIIKSGIKGLFKPLDPYSVFLEGSRKDRLEMLTRGKYGGVGIQINTRRDTLIITGVMEDSPAYSEGLSIGDKIIMVDSTSTIGFTTKEVSALIKGEKGTEVTLGIYRPSTRRKYEYVLTRDQIIVKDVPYYGVDEDGIGYVRITKFSRYTARDFRVAMKSFSESDNLNGIVIDLRNNSGGLLRNALSILDNLVEKNTLLLSTRGRNKNSNSKKYARQNPIIGQDVPIVVLINKGSASASEIVAGTLQDLDRAVIMGEKSFGKGLVQSMFPINDSTKLKLTTAKYYTPSGRLIQKYDYLENGVLTDGLDKSDSTFFTIGGRKVKGGGGITPDIALSRKTIPPFVSGLWRQGLFLTFAATYVPSRDIQTPVVITDKIILDFKQFLEDYDFKYSEPGEKEFTRIKDIIAKSEDFKDRKSAKLFSKLFFWQKSPSEKLFGDLEKFYKHKKDNPFNSKENLKGIRNGLYREMSSVVTGLNKDRIKAALSYDNIYDDAKTVLLNANRYYDILSPEADVLDTAEENSIIIDSEDGE